ncbi:MAG: carboxylating nicotinate-nucleotide diphosphorylase [Phycisphaerales bacterium]|nr:MAG: carboxylating nicotinate-nucleotide diphosphorylase [Phycisphaerales bacterium]
MIDLNSLSLPDLYVELTKDGSLGRLLDLARAEDLAAQGDVTTESIARAAATPTAAEAVLVARQEGAIAGLTTLPEVIAAFEADVSFKIIAEDGRLCTPDQILGRLHGPLSAILPLERTLLNLLGRLSGVATLTRQYVDAAAGTKAVVCETRKTTPGLRGVEKYAVRCGGGTLHRLGLHDAALYKDNHLAHVPPENLQAELAEAIRFARSQHDLRFVQVEVDTLDQLERVLAIERGLVDMVLLDNMPPEELCQAVEIRNRKAPAVLLEASGGVTLLAVRAIAETGIDRISVGALTHSAQCLDIGLDIA